MSNSAAEREDTELGLIPRSRCLPGVCRSARRRWLTRPTCGVAQQGAELGGLEWYNTEPLRQEFVAELGPEAGQAKYQRYLDLVAATSPRSKGGRERPSAAPIARYQPIATS
jgi:hypothetical protein